MKKKSDTAAAGSLDKLKQQFDAALKGLDRIKLKAKEVNTQELVDLLEDLETYCMPKDMEAEKNRLQKKMDKWESSGRDENKADKLLSPIKNCVNLLLKEKRKQSERIGRIKKIYDELKKELNDMKKEINKRDKLLGSLLEENKHIPVKLEEFESCVFHLDPACGILTGWNTQTNESKVINIVSPVFKYSHFALVEKFLFLTGGVDPSSEIRSNCYKFDLTVDASKGNSIANMIYPKKCHTLICNPNNDFLISIGGEKKLGSMRECEKYLIKKDKWVTMPSLNVERKYASTCIFKETIYVFGGVSGKYVVKTIETLSLSYDDDNWNSLEISGTPYVYSAIIYPIDNYKLIIGGNTESIFRLNNAKFEEVGTKIKGKFNFRYSTFLIEKKNLVVLTNNKKLLEIDTHSYEQTLTSIERISQSVLSNYSVYSAENVMSMKSLNI